MLYFQHSCTFSIICILYYYIFEYTITYILQLFPRTRVCVCIILISVYVIVIILYTNMCVCVLVTHLTNPLLGTYKYVYNGVEHVASSAPFASLFVAY